MPGKQTRRTFLAGVTGMVGATTLASAQSKKHLAVVGGSAGDPVEYYFRIDGEVEKTADGGPVDDRYVSVNSEDYVRSDRGSTVVRGVVAGGGDAYYHTGEITDFGVSLDHDTADSVSIYHDGRKYGPEEFGPNPPADTPITFQDGKTAVVEGEWGSAAVTDMLLEPPSVYTDYYSFSDLSGTTTISNDAIQIPNWYLHDVAVAKEDRQAMSSPDYYATNPFGGPWNHEVRESDLPNRIVLYGGSADDELEYSFDVSSAVRKTGYAGDDAPIADKHVHLDDDDLINGNNLYIGDGDGATVTGTVAGGGDAYWFSGGVANLQADEGVKVYVDGERRQPEDASSGGGGDDELSHHVVVYGGSADDIISYEVSVSGELAKSGSGGDAPIDDQHVTIDDDDIIEGSTATGTLGGGGDAYRFSGEVTNVEADADANVYVDGERRT